MQKSVEKNKSNPALSTATLLKQKLIGDSRDSAITQDAMLSRRGLAEEEGGPLFVHEISQEDTSSLRESVKLASTFGRISKIEDTLAFKPALNNPQ